VRRGLATLAEGLERVFHEGGHSRAFSGFKVFTEFLGAGSFAGLPRARDAKRLVPFGVHPALIGDWKKQLLAGAEGFFAHGTRAGTAAADAAALQADLDEQIGRLEMERQRRTKKPGFLAGGEKSRIARSSGVSSVPFVSPPSGPRRVLSIDPRPTGVEGKT
jgi:hypothetical protein